MIIGDVTHSSGSYPAPMRRQRWNSEAAEPHAAVGLAAGSPRTPSGRFQPLHVSDRLSDVAAVLPQRQIRESTGKC
jgi:hypothetical protein